MTDRHAGYVVTLAEDVREDDAEQIINALRMVRGVLAVEPVEAGIGTLGMHVAEMRVREEVRRKLLDLIQGLG